MTDTTATGTGATAKSTEGAPPVRTDRPGTRPGRRFEKGNPGRPKGVKDRRTLIGQAAARAIESKAWDVLEALLTSSSWRARLESSRTVLAYSLGLPHATITLAGGLGDLSRELAAALQEARARRAALDAVVPVAGALAQAPGIPEALEARDLEGKS